MHATSVRNALGFTFPTSRFLRAGLLAFASLIVSTSLHAAASAPQWAAVPATSGNSQVALDWNAASGAASYKVRYRTSESTETYTTISNLPLTPTSYTVNSLTNLKSYEFQVGATASGTTTWGTSWHARPEASIHPSGLHAGGQVNGVVRAAAGIMIAATDVGGFQRSIDGGITWRQSSAGLHIDNGTHVASSVVYHEASATLYGLTGGGGTGHFWRSTDNGASWSHQSSSAAIYVDAVGPEYPRDVGVLIAVNATQANTVFVGTNNDGVQKSTDGGATWTPLVLAGKKIRGLALAGGLLYIAAHNTGVYRCDQNGGSLTQFSGSGAPTTPEELFFLGGKLYAAANTQGIRRLDGAATAGSGAAWTNLNVGVSAAWCALDGYVSGSNHVLVVGNSEAPQLGTTGRYTRVVKCTNAEATSSFNWINISSAATVAVHKAMAAGNGVSYWRVDNAYGPDYNEGWGDDKQVDGSTFNIDQIRIDPDNTDRIHVVGQMGIWFTSDGGNSWNPAVVGLSNAVLNTVAVDPNAPGTVYVGDSDHFLWLTDDYAQTMSYVTEPTNTGGKPICYALTVDQNGLIYTGLEEPAGSVWTYARGTNTNGTWAELAGANGNTLREIAASTGKTVHGIGVQHINGTRVVLAAVKDSGIWRLTTTGNWTLVKSGIVANTGAVRTMPFVWPSSNKQLVYFFDMQTGVWRSNDAGQTWAKIWSLSDGSGFSSQFAGSIALRTSNSELFVTTNNTLYRINNADTAGSPTATNLNVTNAGKLAAFGNTLWVACYADGPGADGTADVKLYKSTNGSTFTAISSSYYEGAGGRVTGVAVDASRQYITSGPMGLIVSEN